MKEPKDKVEMTGVVSDGPAEEPAEPTKAELLEQARELDVPGRSNMDKAELADAVEAATAEGNEPHSELREAFTVVVTDERGRRSEGVECDTYDDAILVGLSALKDADGESFTISKRYELA